MRVARKSESGLAGAAIFVVLILVAVVLVLGRGFFGPGLFLSQREATEANLRQITEALTQYATLNQRLPCPAAGIADTGLEDDSTGTVNCNSADGVVPWATLSLRRSAALDGWGRKVSYRVYSGATGLTQTGGASMVNCNGSLGAPLDTSLGTGSLCKPAVGSPPTGTAPPNTPAQFMAAAGRSTMLVVQDQGAAQSGNAFVLISHGETGLGAFPAEAASGRTQLPADTGKEKVNIGTAGVYWIEPRSAPGVASNTAAHFDDAVAYTRYSELVARAKIGSRSWSQYPLSATFTLANVAAAAPGLSGENTGQTYLALGGFLVTGQSTSGTSNIGVRTQDGVTGIGTIGGGSSAGDLNSAFEERLTFQLGDQSEFGKVDVALNAFQIIDYFPLQKERAEISLWRAGDPLQTSTVESWDAGSSPTRCLLRLVTGGMYDRFDVAPVSQTGGGGSTRFTVAGVKACTDATSPCTAEVPGAVACPIPPPSTTTTAATAMGTATATLNGKVEDNGVAKGSGAGYRTAFSFSGYPAGTSPIPLNTGSGTIVAGNCLTISLDANTYVVAGGISSPGTVVLAPPGLRVAIPAFTTRNVTLVDCPTTATFDYGLTCAYSSGTVSATPGTINAGSGSTSVSANVSGLTCGRAYFYRLNAASPGSVTRSGPRTLRTAACAYATPGSETRAPTAITTTTAMLAGFANDNGATTTVTFEYGPTSCYGSSIAATPGTIAAGSGEQAVARSLTGLSCNTWYHYRTVATSASGTTVGDDVAFRTLPCP